MNEKVYIVVKGDDLASIAKKHQLSSWKALYEAPCNIEFRKLRQNPRIIHPGDKLKIPPNALTVTKSRLAKLHEIKNEALKSFTQQERELEIEFNSIKRHSQQIDTIATVLGILQNLAGLAKAGHATLKLAGKELAQANNALLKTHIQNNLNTFADLAGSAITITGEEGLAWGVTKVLLQSWSEMWSPSYWANHLVGQTPDTAYQEAKQHLANIRNKVINSLDDKIRMTQSLIIQLEQETHIPLPRG